MPLPLYLANALEICPWTLKVLWVMHFKCFQIPVLGQVLDATVLNRRAHYSGKLIPFGI